MRLVATRGTLLAARCAHPCIATASAVHASCVPCTTVGLELACSAQHACTGHALPAACAVCSSRAGLARGTRDAALRNLVLSGATGLARPLSSAGLELALLAIEAHCIPCNMPVLVLSRSARDAATCARATAAAPILTRGTREAHVARRLLRRTLPLSDRACLARVPAELAEGARSTSAARGIPRIARTWCLELAARALVAATWLV